MLIIRLVNCSLKNYFRNLPNPLYTFEFHQDFCSLTRELLTRSLSHTMY